MTKDKEAVFFGKHRYVLFQSKLVLWYKLTKTCFVKSLWLNLFFWLQELTSDVIKKKTRKCFEMNTVEEKKSAHSPRADRTCGNVLFPDISLQAHLARGAAVRPGRSCGKVEGCRDAGLHRRTWQTLVAIPPPPCPLAFNNSTETQNAACPPIVGSQWEDVALYL